jgi:hypothetical protein
MFGSRLATVSRKRLPIRRPNTLPALELEPATVALFVAAQAKLGIAPSTLGRRLAAIRLMHVGARLASPHDALQVDEVMRGIRIAGQSIARRGIEFQIRRCDRFRVPASSLGRCPPRRLPASSRRAGGEQRGNGRTRAPGARSFEPPESPTWAGGFFVK